MCKEATILTVVDVLHIQHALHCASLHFSLVVYMGIMPSGHLVTQTEHGIPDKNITKQFKSLIPVIIFLPA
jgi:hypothetical protein